MGYELIAAVDLGSNSFRLQVGRVLDGQIYPLDAIKEPVRLASGLTPEKYLDKASQLRAVAALARFGERLRGFAPEAVRAVATNAMRVAKNSLDFLPDAERALGFPIEIIAGREEARLIYLGAVHSLPTAQHKRLVVDIGGGSTEFIIGKRLEPQLMESLFMGCVSYTLRFFPDGKIDKKRLRDAQVAAAKEIQTIAHEYRRQGWREAVGSSGTARAIADLLELNKLNPGGVTGLTKEGLLRLQNALIKSGSVQGSGLAGLRADRMPVLPGGIAIMSAVFEELGIERMTYSDGALRLGVLYDLVGRFHHEDMRDATVEQFMRRYQVDIRQAERVDRAARQILEQLMGKPVSTELENDFQFLGWAARLHEIGISVAHNGYHKHGAYILTFADMPGFSKMDQARLALLVFGHRGKLEKITALPGGDPNWKLLCALRLASLLHRSRDGVALPSFRIKAVAEGFVLDLQNDWLAEHPLTAMALSEEVGAWQKVGQVLRIKQRSAERDA
ncbi:MAG: exopolyphosphatase [Betaproteobacteria bacterium]|nr:exopolyphosphatase [Betaproteobacteria bacterium]